MTLFQHLIPILMAGFTGIAGASAAPATGAGTDQVLVTVGNRDITAAELQKVVTSSPVATQFNTMDEPEQAMIRGRMLKNLIYSEMLYQQALEQHIDQRQGIKDEVADFRANLLYQRYLLSLRERLSRQDDDQLKDRLKGEPDALSAARAANASGQFAQLKKQDLLRLGKQQQLAVYRKPLQTGYRDPQAVVAQGKTLSIHLSDLVYTDEDLQTVDTTELLRRLDNRVSQQLMVDTAEKQGIDVHVQVENFQRDLIRETLMKEKEASWVPNREILRDYYQQHPELSRVAKQWYIGQLVSADRAQAEQLRQRILDGESLHVLAAEHSIDPYGRQHAGDMGWVRPDQAPEPMQVALKDLPNDTISPVIETPLGFHLVIITDRKPGSQKLLNAVAGGIRRSLILERLAQDYQQLSQQYPINWHLPEHRQDTVTGAK